MCVKLVYDRPKSAENAGQIMLFMCTGKIVNMTHRENKQGARTGAKTDTERDLGLGLGQAERML